jgi:hypothetical protein
LEKHVAPPGVAAQMDESEMKLRSDGILICFYYLGVTCHADLLNLI